MAPGPYCQKMESHQETEGVTPDEAAPGPDPLPGQGAPAGQAPGGRPPAVADRAPPAPAAYAAPVAPVTSPPALRHDPVAVTHPVTATVLSVATGNLTPVRATRGGPSPVMVGRDAELRQLTRLFTSARPQVAMVAGEPGIGKSRLISELLASLPADTPVLLGQAEPGSLGRPYELLQAALEGAGAAAPEHLAALTDAGRSAVERLHAGVSVVARLIGERPAVVVFEDLHWADSESAALFERVADLPGHLLLGGTYRPEEVAPRLPVAGLLARLERRHAVTNLWLDRLGPAETTALLANATGHPVPYRVAMALHQRAGGNPFFLEELLRDPAGGDLEKLDEQPLPWSLAEVLRRQLGELDPAARRIAEAAAVLGQRVPFDLLATVTGEGEADLIAVLRELVARGVLTESDDDEFSFRHALLREALTGQLLGRQRRRLHEAALDALLATGEADPALVAHHARGAGRYADMIAAARRGTASYLAIGSAYQALQLAELALDELGDDLELLAGAAHRRDWAGRAIAPAEEYGLPDVKLAALLERGSVLVNQPATLDEGRSLLAGVVDQAEKVGEWVLAARAINNLVFELPTSSLSEQAELLERMRTDAERAGFEALSVAAYFEGWARLAMAKGDLGKALAALAEGRRRERAFAPRGRRIGYHSVLMAGLSLENGDFAVVDEVLDELMAVPDAAPLGLAGLRMHLACRRDGGAAAQAALDALLPVVAGYSKHNGDLAHDRVSAPLVAGLPRG